MVLYCPAQKAIQTEKNWQETWPLIKIRELVSILITYRLVKLNDIKFYCKQGKFSVLKF